MRSRTRRRIEDGFRGLLARPWPKPAFDLTEEPHFLFIITPPFSGSTALAMLLGNAPGTGMLHERGEGQWLVPGLLRRRWSTTKRVRWDSVRAVWLARVQQIQAESPETRLFIEKSPSNLVRVSGLTATFPNHSLMALNRDPYANCSSVLYRLYDGEKRSGRSRSNVLSKLAREWVWRSSLVRRWCEERDVLRFSYEEFCERPAECVARLAGRVPLLSGVDASATVQVKDYGDQAISNHNDRQMARLAPADREAISRVLADSADLVSWFGYQVLE